MNSRQIGTDKSTVANGVTGRTKCLVVLLTRLLRATIRQPCQRNEN